MLYSKRAKVKWDRPNKLALASLVIATISLFATLSITWLTSQISIDITKQLNSHPEIRVQKDNITFFWDADGNSQRFGSDRFFDANSADGVLQIPNIYLLNIGNDMALDIETDWLLLENLDYFNRLAGIEATVLQDYPDNSMELLMRYDNDSECCISDHAIDYISFIQAHSEDSFPFSSSLLDAISFYCYKTFPESDEGIDYSRSFRETEMPSLQISMSYKNAFNERAQKDLTIRFRLIYFKRNSDGSGCSSFEISAYGNDMAL